jgi:hypothetical protein
MEVERFKHRQLESKPFPSIPILPFFQTGRDMFVDFDLLVFQESRAELEQSQMAREQVTVELEQAWNARCRSEEARKVNI